MNKANHEFIGMLLCITTVSAMMSGCQSSIERPDFDPEWSSTKALEQCDKNGDGLIDSSEASTAPGLVRAFKEWDTDGDQMISSEEIAVRVASYRGASASIAPVSFTVTYKRKPLAGAEVTFEPEEFMGEDFEAVTAKTDRMGYVRMSHPEAEASGYPGIYLGIYRVRISKQENGTELLPAKYNTASELGYDAGTQGRAARTNPRFDLE